MIAYIIQVHGELGHLKKMLKWIYHERNQYFFSVDPRYLTADDVKNALPSFGNVHVFQSCPVTWGGESLLIATLDGLRVALTYSGWEYAINLSETCFPIKPQIHLFDFLSQKRREGVDGFLAHFGPVKTRDLSHITPTQKYEEILRPRPGTVIRSDIALREFFTSIEVSPIVNADLRSAIHAFEVSPGVIVCRPMHEIERRGRTAYLSQNLLRMGRVWFTMPRIVCNWLIKSLLATACFEFTKSINHPDECFLQTALLNMNSPIDLDSAPDYNLHHRNGDPAPITDANMQELIESDRFFARKIVPPHASELMSWLDQINTA